MLKKILLASILLSIFSWAAPTSAAEVCYWQKATPQAGTLNYTATCEAGYNMIGAGLPYNSGFPGKDDKCLAQKIAKPTDGAVYACCCGTEVVVSDTVASGKAPKFTMPEWQIKIPTVNLSQPTCVANTDGSFKCSVPWIGEYITGLYNYGMGIAGILAAIVLMAGGVLWLVSGGDASKVTQAKELILGSVVGLIILAAAYVIMSQVNPELTIFRPISIGTIKGTELGLAQKRNSQSASDFKNLACANASELSAGIEFYATGYYKPVWEDTDKFRCVVAMQCSCPNGQDTSKNCDSLYGKTFPNYHPCNSFPSTTPYCNMTATGGEPKIGEIAGPGNCRDTLPYGTKVCFQNKTYTITDTGGGIRGRRIDIWSGSSLDAANASTGKGTLTIGACK